MAAPNKQAAAKENLFTRDRNSICIENLGSKQIETEYLLSPHVGSMQIFKESYHEILLAALGLLFGDSSL